MSLLTGWFRSSITPYLTKIKEEFYLGQIKGQTINITDWAHLKSVVEGLEGKTLLGTVTLQLPSGVMEADTYINMRRLDGSSGIKLYIRGQSDGSTVIKYTYTSNSLIRLYTSYVMFRYITFDGNDNAYRFFYIIDFSKLEVRSATVKFQNSTSPELFYVRDSYLDAAYTLYTNILGVLYTRHSSADMYKMKVEIRKDDVTDSKYVIRSALSSVVFADKIEIVDTEFNIYCCLKAYHYAYITSSYSTLKGKRTVIASDYSKITISNSSVNAKEYAFMSYSGSYIYAYKPDSTIDPTSGVRHMHADGGRMYIRYGIWKNKTLGKLYNLSQMRFTTNGTDEDFSGLGSVSIDLDSFSHLLNGNSNISSNVPIGTSDPAKGVRIA